jgi:hypothetical protein
MSFIKINLNLDDSVLMSELHHKIDLIETRQKAVMIFSPS